MLAARGTIIVLLVAVLGACAAQRKLARTGPVTTEVKTGVNFDCPEEFGYYPHPTDCTQYYVCVFGGALLESCTGGLMYSHELQTCDWPRNVGCDAATEVSAPTAAATSPPASTQQQHRGRYTPPPPPPPPAAIVTSRGQPRQLQQQQEIIKQRQLYEDAEETLPPADEIESDRQQRVYRGQPSTLGQVQRDRDGLRNSNAIPTYSGRAEKIGIISFGTAQQSPQPIQQYSTETKRIDVTNDLRRRRRRKRQAPRSRPHGTGTPDETPWRGKLALRPSFLQPPFLVHTQPYPHGDLLVPHLPPQSAIHKFHVASINPQPGKEDDFQPFIPTYQRQHASRLKVVPAQTKLKSENYAYFNLQHVPKGLGLDTTTTLKYPYYFTSPILEPPPREQVSPLGLQKVNEESSSNISHYATLDMLNSTLKETEAITQKYPFPYVPTHSMQSALKNVNDTAMNSTQVKPEFLSPPKLSLAEVLDRIRENQRVKINQTIVSHYTTSQPMRVGSLNDDYYYYDYEDDEDDEADEQDKSIYSSRKSPSKPSKHDSDSRAHSLRGHANYTNSALVPHKPSGLADDEEYYYEEYDYPETTTVADAKSKWDMRYSSRYNEKAQNVTTTTLHPKEPIENVPAPTLSVPNLESTTTTHTTTVYKVPSKAKHNTKSPSMPAKTTKVFLHLMSTTAAIPTKVPTVRQRVRMPSKMTTTPRAQTRHRQTTNKRINDHDRRLVNDQTANRVEVTSAGPSQSPAAVTAATRGLYNGSRHYDPQFDPYYNLYEDDVELYRDVDYSQQYSNSANTYRGTPTPSLQTSTQADEPKRGNAYIQNYNSQDLYQHSNVGDYNEDNRFNDDQSYRQPARQSVRGNQNEEARIQRTTTTTTTTTTTSPRPVTFTAPPARSDANQTRAQSLSNTIPENPGHTLPSRSPHPLPSPTITTHNTTSSKTSDASLTRIDRRLDPAPIASVTYRPKYPIDTLPDASLENPARSAVVNPPAPFTSSTTTDTPTITYYFTKAFRSTPFSKVEDYPARPAEYLKRKIYYIRNTEPSVVVTPTTYAPPKFFLKSLLKQADNLTSTASEYSQEYVIKSNGIKAIRKYINPIAINNVFASSTELYPAGASGEEQSSERVAWRGKVKFPQMRFTLDDEVTTYRDPSPLPTFTTHTTTASTTTITTTPTPTPAPGIRSNHNYQTTERYRHYVESTYQQPQAPKFRNTVEVPQLHQLLADDEPVFKPIPDQFPAFKPKPPVISSTTPKPKLNDDDDDYFSTTKTIPDPVRIPATPSTPQPSRASRVNAAIKSMIGRGAARGRSNTKCSETPSSNIKCSESKQRTQTQSQAVRTRGSAHYTATNAVVSNSAEPVNRGTPPSRSRPTLKPSTSIVSKAQEFVDIYRFPPRRPDAIYPQPQPDKTAAKCRKDVCLLPDCSCGGKEIPGDLPVEEVPQMVLMTFDDAVNDLNQLYYRELFENGRVNPNGCPVSATFYVSHEWTDYSQVQNLYADGHELASHTVSHSFGEQFSQKKWTREVAGQREILSAYGGVKLEDVRGMRAPFLSVGGNKMFKMLYDSNFTYDSSMPIYENKPPSWPYTLDYKLFHDCMIPPCPTRSYPGVWEVPMVMWQDLNGGRCSMGDACSNPGESEGVFKMLMKNFERHYTTNRAPFGLFYHAAWFTQPHHKAGFIQFLDTINQMKDVFLVTNWQAIQWVRDPTPMSRINNFQPFQCNYSDRPKRCNNPKVCNLWHKSGVRYMRTCQPCPDIYPWTGNTGIRSSRIDNDIED